MVLRLKRCFLVGTFLAFAGIVTTAVLFMVEESRNSTRRAFGADSLQRRIIPTVLLKPASTTSTTPTTSTTTTTMSSTTSTTTTGKVTTLKKLERKKVEDEKVNDGVHIFYYPWYGNPQFDNGSYYHWNHEYLQHWNKNEAKKWPKGHHNPPEDIGSTYYPQLGCYSSRDVNVIRQHFRWIRSAGVGTVVVSWYPPSTADGQGHSWDDLIPTLLDTAKELSLKVTFQIEPYAGRNAKNMKENVAYLIKSYGDHSAFYYYGHFGKRKPLLYVYDSYEIKADEWKTILHPQGADTLRNTDADAHFLGLVVKEEHKTALLSSGFDGMYTYFASNGFTFGSTWENWAGIRVFCKSNKLIFSPSVGPGYNDERVRPWNAANTKGRDNGTYYARSFRAAVQAHSDLISVTSFNEWHEGTQIEPAVPQNTPDGEPYADYSPMQPNFYLLLTKEGVGNFTREQNGPIEDVKNQIVAAAVVQ